MSEVKNVEIDIYSLTTSEFLEYMSSNPDIWKDFVEKEQVWTLYMERRNTLFQLNMIKRMELNDE